MSIYGEALPPEQEPFSGADMARLALYGQFRQTLQECDANSQAVGLWTDEYIALVCAGMQRACKPGRSYFNGVVRLLGHESASPNICMLYSGGTVKEVKRLRALRMDVFEHSDDSGESEAADTALRRTIVSTIYTIGRAQEFAEIFVAELMPATPLDPAGSGALLEEYPNLAVLQRYGEALIRMRSGLIPPLSAAEAQKYAIGTD